MLNDLPTCHICKSNQVKYRFTLNEDYPVWECEGCQTLFLYPQPNDDVLNEIYSADYFLGGNTANAQQKRQEMKQDTARIFLDQLHAYRKQSGGRLLEIGCGQGELLIEAEAAGYEVVGTDYSEHAAQIAQSNLKQGKVFVGDIELLDLPEHSFDVVISIDVIEHTRDPLAFTHAVRRLLKPDGVLLIVTISLDSWTAKLLRHNWMEFKTEHLTYFSNNSLLSLMFLGGFQQVRIESAYKVLNPRYIMDHFERYQVAFLTTLLRFGYRFLPPPIREKSLKLTGSGVVVMARAADIQPKRKLSIVMPVYNEVKTFETIMTRLLEFDLGNIEKEIIIIESNSTDGTRESVMQYQDHPLVKVILQDKAAGKGAAVREGFKIATGDFVLIQDGDLEYDVADYPTLLTPLVEGQHQFVLGSRHISGRYWNIRTFEQNRMSAFALNMGHVLFATLLNLLYGQSLKDPFTMYKVFLRDCLDGLAFESDRFDFDFELVIKLLRKGYQPIEIPVSYKSRPFTEGKKVSVFRDPLTWIRALIKFRFSKLYED